MCIRQYKIDGTFDKAILNNKKFIESYRITKDGLTLEVIGSNDQFLKDEDFQKMTVNSEEDQDWVKNVSFESAV